MSTTIAAISTPPGAGGLAVIRISGDEAIHIARQMFRPMNGTPVSEMEGYTCAYGTFYDGDTALDDGVLTVFRAPRSYTGEDTAELSCHGGHYISEQLLRAAFALGAVPAEAGEFTKRAFLAGKFSLTQAEAVMDLIAADGEASHRCARSLREGAVFRRIHAISDRLVTVLADLAAWADYPDEDDVPEVSHDALLEKLHGIRTDLAAAADTYDYGRILREGIHTVLCGRPNVGKSTVMNALSGFARSIVTDRAGTTRDVIEERVRIGDLVLRLADTAGLRDTTDEIEQLGVDLARQRIAEADLILAVFDGAEPLCDSDYALLDEIGGRKAIALVNKSDKGIRLDLSAVEAKIPHVLVVSAKTADIAQPLGDALKALFLNGAPDPQSGVVSNERQRLCLSRALEQVNEAIAAVSMGVPQDAVTVLLDEAANALLELTGERATGRVVDEVFARFCVGK
ncbi:MAG: tRNA uridine-5-carboxymethylaminomethyl(34) synthesis GTPase MnmE [Ruminococcus sp.]|nr:tRNA uridine-5-carboxymethylaminomethyl(34) synthesis GTPase MnmE [Ruminococcus sp.]